MSDYKVVLPTTTEEWQRDMNMAYNQALEDLSNALCDELDNGYIFTNKHQILHFVEQLKEN